MVRKAIQTKNIPTESPRPVGRPSTYSDDIAEVICERMINGESFVQICSDPTMPSRATLYRWRAAHPDFDTGCARAREGLADYLVDRIEQMADDTTELNVNSQKVKISVAQWRAEKMAPRIYGPRVNTEVTGNATLNVTHSTTIDVKTLDAEGRDALRRALLAAGKIIEHDEHEGDA